MLEIAIKELTEETRRNTVVLTHLVALLTKENKELPPSIVSLDGKHYSTAISEKAESAEVPAAEPEEETYPDDATRNARLDLAANYIPEVPDHIDTKLVPLVKGSTGLPEGERNKAYYDAHIRPHIAALAKINVKEVKKIFAFYEAEAKKEGREFADLSAVPVQRWDELYGRILYEIDRTEHPEKLKEQVAEAKTNAKAQIAAEEEAAKPILPEGERDVVFYAKYVRTELMELVKLSVDKAKAVVASYGVADAKLIPSDQWENVVLAVRAEIQAIKAGG